MNDFHQLFAFHISHSNRKIQSLFDYVDPALRSFDVTHLDAGQCLVEFLGNRTHLLHTAWEADFFAVVYDLSDWRDNCCSTAKSAFCKIFYFVQIYFTFFDFQSEIMFCNLQDRTACDRRKDAVGLRSYQLAVFGDKDNVCAAGLLDLGTCLRIQVDVLIETVLMSIACRLIA